MAAALAAALVLVLGTGPVAAQAQAKPKAQPKPTAVQITGKTLPKKLLIEQQSRPDLFQQLLNGVSFMATATPQTGALKSSALGPMYTVTVLIKNTPQQVYDVYPQAVGGPRAHRKAGQPSGKKTVDGWFFVSPTLREVLRVSGAPIPPKLDVAGGIGGGIGDEKVADVDPVADINNFIDEFRRLFLLNGAVLVVILFGLASIAFLIRRRV